MDRDNQGEGAYEGGTVNATHSLTYSIDGARPNSDEEEVIRAPTDGAEASKSPTKMNGNNSIDIVSTTT